MKLVTFLFCLSSVGLLSSCSGIQKNEASRVIASEESSEAKIQKILQVSNEEAAVRGILPYLVLDILVGNHPAHGENIEKYIAQIKPITNCFLDYEENLQLSKRVGGKFPFNLGQSKLRNCSIDAHIIAAAADSSIKRFNNPEFVLDKLVENPRINTLLDKISGIKKGKSRALVISKSGNYDYPVPEEGGLLFVLVDPRKKIDYQLNGHPDNVFEYYSESSRSDKDKRGFFKKMLNRANGDH